MGSLIRVMFDTIKVFVLFIGCTVLFYFGMMWINQEYQYYHRYDEPKSGALKASALNYEEETQTWWDRIMLFYLSGE